MTMRQKKPKKDPTLRFIPAMVLRFPSYQSAEDMGALRSGTWKMLANKAKFSLSSLGTFQGKNGFYVALAVKKVALKSGSSKLR